MLHVMRVNESTLLKSIFVFYMVKTSRYFVYQELFAQITYICFMCWFISYISDDQTHQSLHNLFVYYYIQRKTSIIIIIQKSKSKPQQIKQHTEQIDAAKKKVSKSVPKIMLKIRIKPHMQTQAGTYNTHKSF